MTKNSFMPAAEEQRLILQVQEGNRDAFRVLIETFMKQAYDVAFGMVGNHDDADDIAQEAFVKVHRAIRTFRGDSGFGTWLFRIVTNLSLNRLKQKKRRQRREVDLTIAENEVSPMDSQTMETRDTQMHVERALHELPTLQRAVVMLRHMNGLSTRQVSRILECSEGTVKTHLHRGLKKMRMKLQFLREEAI
jgi:RNA polymerase sigma-70 factor (ECF subfamily)